MFVLEADTQIFRMAGLKTNYCTFTKSEIRLVMFYKVEYYFCNTDKPSEKAASFHYIAIHR